MYTVQEPSLLLLLLFEGSPCSVPSPFQWDSYVNFPSVPVDRST